MLRWPDRRDELVRAADGPIVELFESYEQASVAFIHWSKESRPDARALADDYRDLLNAIEHEINNVLARQAPIVWTF